MAEMMGLSRGLARRTGGFRDALRRIWPSLFARRRDKQLRVEEWSEYLLRDIGLEPGRPERSDPYSLLGDRRDR